MGEKQQTIPFGIAESLRLSEEHAMKFPRKSGHAKRLKNSLEHSPKINVGSVKGHKKSWLVELV